MLVGPSSPDKQRAKGDHTMRIKQRGIVSSPHFSRGMSPVLAAALLWALTPTACVTAEPTQNQLPLLSEEILETAWYEAAASPSQAVVPAEDSLAERVAALERTIHEMETTTPAAAEEELPAEAPKECVPKQVDIIAKPTFTPTGRIYFNGVTYDDDNATAAFFNTDRNNELGFRTFRIGGKGNIYENLLYSIEFELRGGPLDITYKDIYMQQTSLPILGNFRGGHFKEPIGLEEFGSDLYVTFMEKNYATSTFAPSRNFGLMMYNRLDASDDATWFAGLFRADSPDAPTTNTGLWRDDRNDWTFASRFVFLPYYDEPSNGRYLVHLGGSYSYRNSSDVFGNQNTSAVVQNGLAEFSPKSWVGSQAPIGVGAEGNSDEWNQFGGEFLVIWGSASLQAEYFQAIMNSGEDYSGASVFVTYFLTGEYRAYRKETKTVDRTHPFEPAFWIDTRQGWGFGRGAWELAAGYSFADLEDGHDITATRQRAFVDGVNIGLNWYHNPWSRLQINWNHEITDFVNAGTPDSDANIFGIRWQVDWQ